VYGVVYCADEVVYATRLEDVMCSVLTEGSVAGPSAVDVAECFGRIER
jgi:hypothetical protein